jgi:hypothetical protein
MKTYKFKKTEHHQVTKAYNATLDEDDIRTIMKSTDMPEEEVRVYVAALAIGEDHPLFSEALEIVFESDQLDERWEWSDEDDWWTDRKGGYPVDIDFENGDPV